MSTHKKSDRFKSWRIKKKKLGLIKLIGPKINNTKGNVGQTDQKQPNSK